MMALPLIFSCGFLVGQALAAYPFKWIDFSTVILMVDFCYVSELHGFCMNLFFVLVPFSAAP
jgi:hypothetical protein